MYAGIDQYNHHDIQLNSIALAEVVPADMSSSQPAYLSLGGLIRSDRGIHFEISIYVDDGDGNAGFYISTGWLNKELVSMDSNIGNVSAADVLTDYQEAYSKLLHKIGGDEMLDLLDI